MTQDVGALRRRGVLLAATGILIISPDGLLLRLSSDAGLWDAALIRTLAMGVGLSLLLLAWHRQALPSVLMGLGWGGWTSVLLLSLSNVAFVAAVSMTTVANTLLILAAMPLFSAVLGLLFIGEGVRSATWMAIALAILGIVTIVGGGYGGFGPGNLKGDAMALLAAFLIAANLVLMRRFPHIDALVVLGLSGFTSAMICWPHADLAGVGPRSIVILTLLGGVVIPLSLALFFRGLRYLPAAEIALFSLIETVLGPLWTWIGVGEVPGTWALVGGGIVIAAIVLNGRVALQR
jgi:drug/metabolite transporter (DMT)-like permease